MNGFVHSVYEGHGDQPIALSITTLITSDFAAGAVLISFGAVLGQNITTSNVAGSHIRAFGVCV